MKGVAYLHSSKEQMREIGTELGLSEKALDKFIYALYEVKVEFEVNEETGKATDIKVIG